MLSDFHVHTEFSGDSATPAREQIEAALQLGMKEICITDHHDYGSEAMTHINFILDLPAYLSGIHELAKEYKDRILVLTGIELGLMMREKEYLEDMVPRLPVDYIIGSSHFIDGYDIYDRRYYEGRSEFASFRRFFESTLNRVKSLNCFDCLGHLDCIIRYGPEKNKNYRPADYKDLVDEILKTLIQKGKGLECNTAGFKYGLGHPHPYEEILARYRELGGELITVGSDGHRPKEVGGAFLQAEEILKKCGFRYYTVYHKRKPVFYKI